MANSRWDDSGVIFNFAGQSSSVWVWLAPVLTFCGSLVVAAVALITVWQTNKRADMRELNQWRRDHLLRLGVEVTECSSTAMDEIHSIAEEYDSLSAKDIEQRADRVDEWVLKIISGRHALKLIGSESPAESADNLWEQINKPELRRGALTYRTFRRRDRGASQQELETAKNQFEEQWQAVKTAHNNFTDAVERDITRLKKPKRQTE